MKKEKDFSHNISKVVAGRELHLFVFSSSEQKGAKEKASGLPGIGNAVGRKEKKGKRKRKKKKGTSTDEKKNIPCQTNRTNEQMVHSKFETPMLGRTDDCTYVD